MEINRLTMETNQFRETKEFYVKTLGFQLINEDNQSFILQAGRSELRFIEADHRTNPFYHFAFTICINQFSSAKKWLEDKVVLNKNEGEDEVHFSRGHSLYFEDPSGNIVEFYGRYNFVNSKCTFSIEDIIEISEINLTTRDVLGTAKKLIDNGLAHQDEDILNESYLNFVGSENVYFLVGPIGRVWFFSTKPAEGHPVKVELINGTTVTVDRLGDMNVKKRNGSDAHA